MIIFFSFTFDFMQDFLDFLLTTFAVYIHFKNTSLEIKKSQIQVKRRFLFEKNNIENEF